MYNLAHLLASGTGTVADRSAAYGWYLRAARLGHARAMNLVGRFLENGWGVERDAAAAKGWYQRSAQAGDFRGQANHASMLADEGLVDEAVQWLQRALGGGTPSFVARLRRELAGSAHGRLRELAWIEPSSRQSAHC